MQAKQVQIDGLLSKLDNSAGDLERLREEKDQEIEILQAGMDTTIEQLNEARQVWNATKSWTFKTDPCIEPRIRWWNYERTNRYTYPRQPQKVEPDYW